MNKNEKALRRLPLKTNLKIFAIIAQIRQGNTAGLDIKKLKGNKDCFRVRIGEIRLIYLKRPDGICEIKSIAKRDDQTYRDF